MQCFQKQATFWDLVWLLSLISLPFLNLFLLFVVVAAGQILRNDEKEMEELKQAPVRLQE
jgi:hypothetical protein